jgi:hypothetical protein
MIRRAALLGLLVVLAGCASQPSSDPPAPAGTADPPAATAATGVADPPAATVATADTPVAATVEPATNEDDATRPPPGWSAKKRAGKVVHCKTVEVTGSHFPREVCLEPKQLKDILAKQKRMAERTLDIPGTVATQAQ